MRGRRVAGALPGILVLAVLTACGGGVPQDTPPPTSDRPRANAAWSPAVGDTWQWQLKGPLNTSYEVVVYDIDLFDTSQATINVLHERGRRIVCYFSADSSEDWRPDFGSFAASDMGLPLDNWPGERWLDVRSSNVRTIMRARLELARSKRCDGVEPDNVDAYANDSGFDLNAANQLDFNRFLAVEAHAPGLAVGLKNDVDQSAELLPDFDSPATESRAARCGKSARRGLSPLSVC